MCPGELSGTEGSLREQLRELQATLTELDAEKDQLQAVADTRAQDCAQLQERVETLVGSWGWGWGLGWNRCVWSL